VTGSTGSRHGAADRTARVSALLTAPFAVFADPAGVDTNVTEVCPQNFHDYKKTNH